MICKRVIVRARKSVRVIRAGQLGPFGGPAMRIIGRGGTTYQLGGGSRVVPRSAAKKAGRELFILTTTPEIC